VKTLLSFWFFAIPIACGAAALLAPIACHPDPSPAEVAGHARNAAIGLSYKLDLDACFDKAKISDAGNQVDVYETCARLVDTKHGKKP
jgi:hypothetical protein